MKLSTSSAALLFVAALSAAVSAQSAIMADAHKMDMKDMKDVTYTGCLGAGSAVGTFTLTHLTTPAHMRLEMTKKDAPKKAAPVAATLSLTSSSVDLSMHLGHEVSVTGLPAPSENSCLKKGTMSDATPALIVKSLKVVAASCP
jgi:hypothetical protein